MEVWRFRKTKRKSSGRRHKTRGRKTRVLRKPKDRGHEKRKTNVSDLMQRLLSLQHDEDAELCNIYDPSVGYITLIDSTFFYSRTISLWVFL